MNSTPLPAIAAHAESSFAAHFKQPSQWLVMAPGRVNLIGEHTDYNNGFVLPMAIDRSTVIAAAEQSVDKTASNGTRLNIFSENLGEQQQIQILDGAAVLVRDGKTCGPAPNNHWSDYIIGVITGFIDRGAILKPLNLYISNDMPLGGGLSSSAALEVGLALLLEAALKHPISATDKVLLCQRAENEYAGMPCGLMDQFTVVHGKADHALLLDCALAGNDKEATPGCDTSASNIPFKLNDISLLIINSGVHHEHASGEYRVRRAECESANRHLNIASLRELSDESNSDLDERLATLDSNVAARVRHIVSENARTLAAAQAMRASDWQSLGELMLASHASMRDDFAISCAEIDTLVEISMAAGALGARMTGGGFGGCVVALVATQQADAISDVISAEYAKQTGVTPNIIRSRAADGARLLKG